MKDKRHMHGLRRSARGFDAHQSGTLRQTGSKAMRKEKVWRFFDARNDGLYPFEAHFRSIARTAAISGKHIRAVEEPVRESHRGSNPM